MVQRETMVKNKFSRSMGTGIGAVFGGKGRTFFVIQHKSETSKHKLGENQEIIVDYVEIGRDSKCGIRFGEDSLMVSRKHAAIAKEGERHIITQLSKINETLVNGRPVNKKWFLENGDEIQLSSDGPKMSFHVPSNPSVKSIGLSRRLSLFRQQALRPYKQAITALSVIFIVGLGVLTFFLVQSKQQLVSIEEQFAEAERINKEKADSLIAANRSNTELINQLKSRVANLRSRSVSSDGNTISSNEATAQIESLFPDVYFIYADNVKVTFEGVEELLPDYTLSGTGFMLADGSFVTARHVVQPWAFLSENSNQGELTLNIMMNLGASIDADINCYSPSGQSFTIKSSRFVFNNSNDERRSTVGEDGENYVISIPSIDDGSDWASAQTGRQGQLSYSAQFSENLQIGEELHILGYPMGLGANNTANISPLYCKTTVAQAGLQNGIIVSSDRNFDFGNSGGPVFAYRNDKFVVVGVVSAGMGSAVGIIVPISKVRR